MNREQPALVVSSCLLGMNVRYDGNSKHDSFISSVLIKYFDLFPVCPEVAIGMGVPCPPIQLRIIDNETRAICIDDHEVDVTTSLQAYGRQQATHVRAFCGYIFKSRSPSCGISDTEIFSDHGISAGPGIYAREILHGLPYLPAIDETQLDQAETKDNFLEQVFSMERWHQLGTSPITINHLFEFHATHHMTLSAHGNEANVALSETISDLCDPLPPEAIDDYLKQFHNCLKTPLTHRDHIRILTNLQNFLAPIGHDEKERLYTEITDYRSKPEKLVIPLMHIKQLTDSYNPYDLARQAYINPTPAEIALRYSK
ncbi:MAG: DUF523 and DUF1722 domain-containing protein [Gammaproteobacteria bacterium]|jgi:uncharacterized protein YbbK (DUF523 family)/uncharacterized protein YbgA (DUF1722 family)